MPNLSNKSTLTLLLQYLDHSTQPAMILSALCGDLYAVERGTADFHHWALVTVHSQPASILNSQPLRLMSLRTR